MPFDSKPTASSRYLTRNRNKDEWFHVVGAHKYPVRNGRERVLGFRWPEAHASSGNEIVAFSTNPVARIAGE
jgi:hypothetical protein